jgi:large subunit ribosomal protein L10
MEAIHARKKRSIPEWKIKLVEELAEYFKQYPVVGIADLTRLPTNQVQQLRKKFRKQILFKVAKKNLILRAVEKAGLDKEKIAPLIEGTTMLMFTHMNPFKMYRQVEAFKVPIPAKPGQVTDKEIVIPEGDTGIAPGPMLSVFGKLRIPYEIRKGTVYVKKDTVVAKPGDVISPELAGLLQQIGIMPFEVGLTVKAAIDNGIVIPREDLLIDMEEVKAEVMLAATEALGLAAEIVFAPVPEAVEAALVKAELALAAIVGESGFLTPDVAEYTIRKATSEALALIAALGDKAKELGIEEIPTPAPAAAVVTAEEKPAAEEEKKEEEEEKEEDVDIGEGLSGLFGF